MLKETRQPGRLGKHDIAPFHAMMYVERTSARCGGAMEEDLRSRPARKRRTSDELPDR